MTLGEHPESGPISANAKQNEFFEIWLPDGLSFLRIMYSAIRELRAAVKSENVVVRGVLLGSISDEEVCLQKCETLRVVADMRSPDPARAERALAHVITARQQDSLDGALTPIGFFRTTPLDAPVMNESDYRIARRYLRAPGSFFLVIHTSRQTPWSANLFTWRDRGPSMSMAPASTFVWDEHVLPTGASNLTTARRLGSASLPAPGSVPLPSRLRAPPSLFGSSRDRSRNIVTTILVVAATLGIGTVAYRVFRPGNRVAVSESPSPGDLALKVTRNGQDFEISWNQSSTAVKHALYGFLTIRDSEYTRIKQLKPDQLRGGHILYTPASKEPKFTLELTLDDQRTASDSIQVLQPGFGHDPTLLGSDPASSGRSKRSGNSGMRMEPPPRFGGQNHNSLSVVTPVKASTAVVGVAPSKSTVPEHPDRKPFEITESRPPSTPRESSIPDIDLLTPAMTQTSPPTPQMALLPVRAPSAPNIQEDLGTKREQAVRSVEPVAADFPRVLQQPKKQPEVRASRMAGLTSGAQVSRQMQPQVPIQIAGMLANQEIEIRVTINEKGRVVNSAVASQVGSMSGIFVPSALEAARQWVFKPAQRGAENVASEYVIKFVFAPRGPRER